MSALAIADGFALLRPLWLVPAAVLAALAVLLHRPPVRDGWRRVLSPAVLGWFEGRDGEAGGSVRDPDGADRSSAGRRLPARIDLVLLAAALLAVALAAPATRQSDGDTWRHSTGWIVLADVSRSMTLDDTVPTRLSAMREVVLALSERAGARPLALALYAGDAFLAAPSAFDRRLVNEHAALLEYGVVPLDGSNLARALSLAESVAVDSGLVRARVFVLGDSGGTGKSGEAAARHLADAGHRVDVVLFGASAALASGEVAAGDATGGGGSGPVSAGTDTDATTALGDVDAAPDTPEPRLEGADVTTLTASATAGALSVDVAASARLASAGGGTLVRADAFGTVSLDALGLDAEADPADVAGLEAVLWENRSHWLLLALLPLLLVLFREERV